MKHKFENQIIKADLGKKILGGQPDNDGHETNTSGCTSNLNIMSGWITGDTYRDGDWISPDC